MKSNYLSGKVNEGDGVYPKPNKFVYFSLERKLFSDTLYQRVKLCFSPELLFNRNFYLSTVQSPYPELEGKWINSDFGGKQIKIKYPMYSKNITKILNEFYFYNYLVFWVGQVAIKNKFNITKYLVAIEFISGENVDKNNKYYIKAENKKTKILNLLKKKYPNVIIKNQIVNGESLEYIKKNIDKEENFVKNKNKNK
jgi:hypothetical protein